MGGKVFAPYFFGYLITDRPVKEEVKELFERWLKKYVKHVTKGFEKGVYPLGPASKLGWGSATNKGRWGIPLMLMYRLTGDQVYLDGASQLADYVLGLNPIGKSYTTGLGANPPTNPLHLDSYYTLKRGLGPVPGITVYGPKRKPKSVEYQRIVWGKVYPAWEELPEQRRYCEGWSLVEVAEFTSKEIAMNACLFSMLGPTKTEYEAALDAAGEDARVVRDLETRGGRIGKQRQGKTATDGD
jgi:endoglucanase